MAMPQRGTLAVLQNEEAPAEGITFLAAAGNKSEDHSDGQDEG